VTAWRRAGAVLYFTIMGLSRPFLALGFAARRTRAWLAKADAGLK
jgi:hypothetical protein